MPNLVYRRPGQPKFASFPLYKPVTSIGRDPDNDLVIDDSDLRPSHALIHFDGSSFTLQAVDRHSLIQQSGKRVKKKVLTHGDEFKMGRTTLSFLLVDEPRRRRSRDADESASRRLHELRKLHQFSKQLLGEYELTALVELLLDSTIDVSGADKGILVLMNNDGEPRVQAARDASRTSLSASDELVSDSIMSKVLRTKQPLIVSDAQGDSEFSNSQSVVNLNLCSVMCVPLLDRGSLIGLLVVGNDNVANLFTQEHLELLTIFAAQASLILTNAMLVNELKLDNEALAEKVEALSFGQIIGASDAMREIFRKVEKVAHTDVTVLIQGETGTGKELIARELHNRSHRAKGPFITINCGAIPENLLESELFGHVRGAFTGATQTKPGKFHLADGGTIFLDELGEMPLNLQVKLLRVLQERVVSKVGDTRNETVDIRVVAATNKDLDEEVREGRFREDLFYRLNVVTLHLPPLRNRDEDVILIANYFLSRFCEQFGVGNKALSNDSQIAMKKYSWPGNIRQLENRLKKAVILADRAMLEPDDLDLDAEDLETILDLAEAKERFQRNYINEVLARNNGNRTKTARDLGVDPRTIFRHLEKEASGAYDKP